MDCREVKCDATADFCCKIGSVSRSELVRGYNNCCVFISA